MQQIWNASSGVSSHENITVSPSWKICDDLGWSGSVKNCGVHKAIWVHHPTAFQLAPPAISSLCSTAGQLFVTAWPFFSHINLVRPCTMSNIFKCSTADQLFVTARPFSHRILLVPPWIIASQLAFVPCEPVLGFCHKTIWRLIKTTCWNTCSFVPCVTRECDELLLNAKN